MLRADYPTLLPWRGRYDLSRLLTSRCYNTKSENGSRVFTSPMLNKMYYLVANPEDRVSRDVAHFQMVYQFIAVHQSNLYTLLKLKEKVQVKK